MRCPLCASSSRSAAACLGYGFDCMSPELARHARSALGMSHTKLGQAIGERPATVMRYELGKPVDDAVVEKLRAYFQSSPVRVLRNGRVTRYQTSSTRGAGKEGAFEEKVGARECCSRE